MVDLSDASFLGKLLVLPANVRLDWKVFARYKQSSLFGLDISNEEKCFIILTPDVVPEDGVVDGLEAERFRSDVAGDEGVGEVGGGDDGDVGGQPEQL